MTADTETEEPSHEEEKEDMYDYSYKDIVERMLDTKYLSVQGKGEVCREFTSYDRKSAVSGTSYVSWNANGDGTGYIRKESDGGLVIAEMEGAGYISRIWSATASSGKVKIFIDGESEAAFDLSFCDYFSGKTAPFNYSELCYDDSAEGKNCYVPITYSSSCKIVAYGDWGKFYHINYTSLPEGSRVEGMPTELSDEQKAALCRVNDFFASKRGTHPQGMDDAPFENFTVSGSSPAVKTLEGKGAISGLLVKFGNITKRNSIETVRMLKQCTIRIYWDGMKEPFVNAPIGDFFGSAYGQTDISTLLIGVRHDGTFYNYFYMPYLESAKIEIAYTGEGKIPLSLSVCIQENDIPHEDMLYYGVHFDIGEYHASAQRKPDHHFLSLEGTGRLVGLTLHSSKSTNMVDPLSSPGSPWWGEGDEKFFIDGETFPSWFGTGTEDFFGYAWCSPKLFERAYHCQSYCVGGSNTKGNRSVTRLLVGDNIPFYSSFEGYLEKYYSDDHVRYGYTSYFYLSADGKINTVRAPEDITSYFTPDPGAVASSFTEGEYMTVTLNAKNAKASAQSMLSFGGSWSDGKQLFITGMKTGESAQLILPAEKAGNYMLLASFTSAPDYGRIKLSINGKDSGAVYDLYSSSVRADALTEIGTFELTEGFTNEMLITVTGKNTKSTNCFVGLDFLVLIPADEYKGMGKTDLSAYTDVSRVNAKNEAFTLNRYEGEDLVPTSYATNGKATVQLMSSFGSAWSEGAQLWWRPDTKQAVLKLRIFVPESGEYDISGAFTTAKDYGIFDVKANGKVIASGVDFYSNGVKHKNVSLGTASLTAGYNELTFTVTGKGASATSYMLGVDFISLLKK